MKKSNLFLSMIMLCLLLILSLDTNVSASEDSDFAYKDNADGTITITEYRGDDTSVVIPSMLNGKKVTVLGESAFSDKEDLLSITIPDSVRTIEFDVFANCTNLKTVVLQEGVETIGTYAFSNCTSLTDIVIPASVKCIDKYAFTSCSSLKNVLISNSVTTIMYYAFSFCESLTTINIPDSVTTIGPGAFYACSIKQVTIPKTVKYIGYDAFGFNDRKDMESKIPDFCITGYNGTAAETYAKENGFLFISLDPVAVPPASTSSKPSLETIKYGSTQTVSGNKYVVTSEKTVSFKKPKSKKITSIKIPKTVRIKKKVFTITAIDKKAFTGCKNLKKVIIGKDVKKIGSQAFYNCKKLKVIQIKSTRLTKAAVGKASFKGISPKATFYVPKNKKRIYKIILYKRGATKKMTFKANK